MANSTHHDTGYKQLLSHPKVVRDLLTGYVSGPWLDQADLTSLERVNVSESDRQRHDDISLRLNS